MEKWNKEKKEKNQIASSPFNLTILEAKGRILADEEEDARDSAEQQELVSYLIQQRGYNTMPFPSDRSCLNGGIAVNYTIDAFRCNNSIVSKVYYYNLLVNDTAAFAAQDCNSPRVVMEACHCPTDYYNRYCRLFSDITCTNFTYGPYDQDCLAEYQEKHKNKASPPPCRVFNNSGQYDFSVEFDCNFTQTENVWTNESVKIPLVMLRDDMLEGDEEAQAQGKSFNYEIDTPNVRFTNFL